MSAPEHADRFTGRVRSYLSYRPGFPQAILPFLREHGALRAGATIADVGAGTGMLAELFLEAGHRVFAVEPNAEMRAACASSLKQYPQLHIVAGQAEVTTLPDASMDLIMVGRALHWFDWPGAHREFTRILRPQGWVMIAGSGHRDSGAPVSMELAAVLERWRMDSAARETRRDFDTRLRGFLDESSWQRDSFADTMRMNWPSLLGYAASLSAIPRPEERGYEGMVAELRALFQRYETNGMLETPLACRVWLGHLRAQFSTVTG